jgi:hypothetical protein
MLEARVRLGGPMEIAAAGGIALYNHRAQRRVARGSDRSGSRWL